MAAIETAARTTARVTIGKPEPYLLLAAAKSVGADVRRAVMIGDALTDVAAGRAVGARTVLMLTGVTTREMADALPEAERPTRIAADAAELSATLAELARAGGGVERPSVPAADRAPGRSPAAAAAARPDVERRRGQRSRGPSLPPRRGAPGR